MKLVAKGVLHRDISKDSILLGRKDNSEPLPGYCGVLIDLHMAIKVTRDTKQKGPSVDWRTVTSIVAFPAYVSRPHGRVHACITQSECSSATKTRRILQHLLRIIWMISNHSSTSTLILSTGMIARATNSRFPLKSPVREMGRPTL